MTILDQDTIMELLNAEGMFATAMDLEYCLPTRASFLEQAAAAHRNVVKLGVADYEAEAWDCDDFAFLTRSLMRIAHKRTEGHPKAGLAVGVFTYNRDSSGAQHAVVVGVTRDEADYELVFAEPQTGQELRLSAQEKASCMGVYL